MLVPLGLAYCGGKPILSPQGGSLSVWSSASNLRKFSVIAIGVLVVLAISSVACGSSSSGTARAVDFGTRWPLTAPEVVLTCKGAGAVFAKVGDSYYGVNGMGKIWVEDRYPDKARDINRIWREDSGRIREMRALLRAAGEPLPRQGLPSDMSVPRVNITPLLDAGLTLCD